MTAIDQKHTELGGSSGWTGTPIHEERETPNGRGRYRTYQRPDGMLTSIHWMEGSGAWETHGGIRDKWGDLDWENGFLGFPLSDEDDYVEDGMIKGRINFFEGGAIVWYQKNNTRMVFKLVRGEYAVIERETTPLDVAKNIAGIVLEISLKIVRPF